ncbi:2,4-dienoyl-CoA reductase-like NADH-dependent reductase (Old Yellow Enzyme family) [Chromohalobacter marismortui]|uniref:2,4-dienoyl-CoA reductase-like NADH-dependent reductase (Old Yellow Enzyme family) n=1 Tax=Chromohalobacter marismortui TaxID=42055 RepID=A0A4R7NMY4_9GAMM|nr:MULTISPECIES: NADH:flavin oxidoreductase/NADH oxidase [Chromohalobacter]MCI0509667.1 NADH:flavin oxidoreductase/NADH oxidase [Chromohalobacter sp.]MCI0593658.1 NADH:flavin oxidoreductase/NADH oxidase [Chromohalobacter sp.]TDU21889.1 2,4-dienoyl-CoA reductase-like NADH-dependent reductase (Old Yellow Enzyme family) [Chromohalobacter marismortui]
MASPKLFSPLTLGRLELPNRIVISPMCQYSADENGSMTDWHKIHLGHLALSGAGLLIVEASAVAPEGRITSGDVGLYSDDNEQAMARVLESVRAYSPIPIGIQLGHAGRKASCQAPWEGGAQLSLEEGGWQTVAPSAVAYQDGQRPPQAMSLDDIEQLKANFVASAKRAERLGFELIELHAAHGYLLHEFLSPLSNQRDDEYGGSLENRMRIVLEIFDAVRAVFPDDKPVGIRISGSDWVAGGWDLEQSVELAKALDARGCSFIDCSGGGLDPRQTLNVGPNYQVPFARRMKQEVAMPVIAVGLITEPEQAEGIVFGGEADAVALARGMLYDPRWPWHAAAKLGATVHAPKQYLRSQPHTLKKLFG